MCVYLSIPIIYYNYLFPFGKIQIEKKRTNYLHDK